MSLPTFDLALKKKINTPCPCHENIFLYLFFYTQFEGFLQTVRVYKKFGRLVIIKYDLICKHNINITLLRIKTMLNLVLQIHCTLLTRFIDQELFYYT